MQNENKSINQIPERMYPIEAVCVDCGEKFTITVKEQLFAQENKGFVLPKRCKKCRNERKSRTKYIVCEVCGEVFAFTANDQEFYKRNNFKEPKRCKNCRKIRKETSDGQDITKEDK